MPLTLNRDDARFRVVLTVSGTLTVDEWASAAAQLVEDGLWRYGLLYDVTAPDAVLPEMNEIAHLVGTLGELIREMGQRGPIVFAATDPGMYRRARLYVDSMARLLLFPAEAFRTLPEAAAWLDSALKRQEARDNPNADE